MAVFLLCNFCVFLSLTCQFFSFSTFLNVEMISCCFAGPFWFNLGSQLRASVFVLENGPVDRLSKSPKFLFCRVFHCQNVLSSLSICVCDVPSRPARIAVLHVVFVYCMYVYLFTRGIVFRFLDARSIFLFFVRSWLSICPFCVCPSSAFGIENRVSRLHVLSYKK